MSCNNCNCNPCNCYASVPTIPCGPQIPCIQYISPISCPISSNLMFSRTATTNVEFFNMPATPKILISAPGSGKLIVPLQIWNSITVSTPPIPYTTAVPTSVTLIMNLGATNLVTDLSILSSIIDQTVYYPAFSGSVANNLANQPLTLSTLSQPVVGSSIIYSYILYTIVNI